MECIARPAIGQLLIHNGFELLNTAAHGDHLNQIRLGISQSEIMRAMLALVALQIRIREINKELIPNDIKPRSFIRTPIRENGLLAEAIPFQPLVSRILVSGKLTPQPFISRILVSGEGKQDSLPSLPVFYALWCQKSIAAPFPRRQSPEFKDTAPPFSDTPSGRPARRTPAPRPRISTRRTMRRSARRRG